MVDAAFGRYLTLPSSENPASVDAIFGRYFHASSSSSSSSIPSTAGTAVVATTAPLPILKQLTRAEGLAQWGQFPDDYVLLRPPTAVILKREKGCEPTKEQLAFCHDIDIVAKKIMRDGLADRAAMREPRHYDLLMPGMDPEEHPTRLWFQLDDREHCELKPFLQDFPFVRVQHKISADAAVKLGVLSGLEVERKARRDARKELESKSFQLQRAALIDHPLPHCRKTYLLEEEEMEWDTSAAKGGAEGGRGRPLDRVGLHLLAASLREKWGFRVHVVPGFLDSVMFLLTTFCAMMRKGSRFFDRSKRRPPVPCCESLTGEIKNFPELVADQKKFELRATKRKNEPGFWAESALSLTDNIFREAPRLIMQDYGSIANLVHAMDSLGPGRPRELMLEKRQYGTRNGEPSNFGPARSKRIHDNLYLPIPGFTAVAAAPPPHATAAKPKKPRKTKADAASRPKPLTQAQVEEGEAEWCPAWMRQPTKPQAQKTNKHTAPKRQKVSPAVPLELTAPPQRRSKNEQMLDDWFSAVQQE